MNEVYGEGEVKDEFGTGDQEQDEYGATCRQLCRGREE